MTSGGYRTVSPRATVARFRKHVSPLTGVVSRLERIEADLPLNTNFYAAHNFSAPAETINELRAGLSGGSFGKGSTAEQGEASALMEAIDTAFVRSIGQNRMVAGMVPTGQALQISSDRPPVFFLQGLGTDQYRFQRLCSWQYP